MSNSLVSITQRVDGETINATKYNGDRQQIVDFLEPVSIEDYEANVSQSNIQTDPGETGAESLAGNLGGMFERLKFIIAEMKGTSLWRTSKTTRMLQPPSSTQATDNALWTPTGTTVLNIRFKVPDGWDTTSNINVKVFRRFNTASGVAKMFWLYSRFRDNTTASTSGSANLDFTHVDGNSHLLTLTINPALTPTLAAGDCVLVAITRTGDDAGDTNTGSIICDHYWIEYTGIAGR